MAKKNAPTPPATTATTAEPLAIEYVRLSELERWPRNPKTHDIPTIRHSLATFGFNGTLVVDSTSGRMVAGHGRLEAVIAMRDDGEAPPARVVERDGEWCVPVLRVAFESEAQAEAFLLVDNRANETGGWDSDALAAILRDLVPQGLGTGLGWTADELDVLCAMPADLPAGGEVHLPEMHSAKAAEDKIEGYLTSGIRQVVLHYTREEYEEFVKLCDDTRIATGADNNAALLLAVLRANAAPRSDS